MASLWRATASLRLVPAGHVLGSAQLVIEYKGSRVGAFRRLQAPPRSTCPPFEPQRCDLFITEAIRVAGVPPPRTA
jgi:putative mRNA 3-end processing factor